MADESGSTTFWSQIKNSKKTNQLSTLQNFIEYEKEALREDHLTFVADNALLTIILSLSWNMVHQHGMETGLNPFMLVDNDIKTPFQINNRLELLLYGGANPSLSDATESLKSKITVLAADGSNRNVFRIKILCRIILPLSHHLTVFLENNYRDIESFRSEFVTYVTDHPHLSPVKLVYHLKHLSTKISDYFKD